MSPADLKALGAFLKEWSTLAVAIVALFTILGGKTPLGALGRWRDSIFGAIFRPLLAGARAENGIKEILAELRTNGGSSLKDAITRIEEFQVRMGGRVDLVMLAMADAAAVYEADADGHLHWASPAYQRITGRSIAELNGWGWSIVIHDEDADRVRAAWRVAVEERRGFSMNYRMVHLDGDVFKVHSVATPLYINDRIIGWSGLVTVEGE